MNSFDDFTQRVSIIMEIYFSEKNRTSKKENYESFRKLRNLNNGNIEYNIRRLSRYKFKFENWVLKMIWKNKQQPQFLSKPIYWHTIILKLDIKRDISQI